MKVVNNTDERFEQDILSLKYGMPIGVITNALVVAVGGIVGALAGDKISNAFKENLNMVFGACAMAMGISSIVLMENMPAVVFSVIVGTSIGLAMHLGQRIDRVGLMMQKGISQTEDRKSVV